MTTSNGVDTANNNQNPGQASQPQNSGPVNIQEGGDKENADNLFFNVMPYAKNLGGVMVEAKIKTQTPLVDAKTGSRPAFMELIKKYKLSIIIVAGLIIAGLAGYFLINKFASNAYPQEDIVVKNPDLASTTPKSANPSPSASTGSDFTTASDWRDKYFPNCSDAKICGDKADPDRDGLSNLQENTLTTDPNNPDSDQDGLSDGDEVNIFGSKPLDSHSAGDQKYSDADYVKGGYDFLTGNLLTQSQIAAITAKIKQYSLHQTTIITLDKIVTSLYKFVDQNASGTPNSASTSSPATGLDQSLSAQQDRDIKRSSTIKNIEAALIKYQADNKTYPLTGDFVSMFTNVKPYLKVATNPIDPINQAPYIYSYSGNSNGTDFTLSFYSETAKQAIVKNAAEAKKDAALEQADINDNQRQTDLDSLRTALLLYSQKNVAGSQDYVFPSKDKYKTVLVPEYISSIPKDPATGQDYGYQTSATFEAFTLKAVLGNPPTGNTGYICNQLDDCHTY